ncbi:MAG TPA: S-methyl-5-thioribose-1-phosphate isomerase [Candidatus Xenobia bacterium]|nr:S-methyl-5-thioribose-1-phosphate isomerase [Candidatus Xenobia bacterium]
MIKTIEWTERGVVLIDQLQLPAREVYVTCTTWQEVAEAIRRMVIRGAPAIGVAAAMGIALGVKHSQANDLAALEKEFNHICDSMAATRPTAVNLFWAIERMKRAFRAAASAGVDAVRSELVDEALRIYSEDLAQCEAIARHGGALLPAQGRVLTHCNAGALAVAGGYGTALGVIRGAREAGKQLEVFTTETRPYLQGARLTAWELQRDGIPTTLITDNMVGHFMKLGEIHAVVVGADRIAANGDTANKIGTYTIAVLAHEHRIPFYVAAPFSSIDLSIPSGDTIPIEERSVEEVTRIGSVRIAPEGLPARHPAFDVTPARLITAIVTERGVAHPPFDQSLRSLAETALPMSR